MRQNGLRQAVKLHGNGWSVSKAPKQTRIGGGKRVRYPAKQSFLEHTDTLERKNVASMIKNKRKTDRN